MESIEKIDEYLAGKLSESDKKSFEEEICTNKELEALVSKQYLAQESIKLTNIRNNVRNIHEQFMANYESEIVTSPKIKRNWIALGGKIAASIAFFMLSFGAYQWYNLSPEKLLSQTDIHYQEPTMRGENNAINPVVETYKQADYLKVVSDFNLLKQPNLKEQFLGSMANYNLGKYDASLAMIDKMLIENSSENEYSNELHYYKGLNLVGLYKINEAIIQLEKIKNDSKNPYSKNISNGFMLKLKALAIKN
jgi:hypothetical protein